MNIRQDIMPEEPYIKLGEVVYLTNDINQETPLMLADIYTSTLTGTRNCLLEDSKGNRFAVMIFNIKRKNDSSKNT